MTLLQYPTNPAAAIGEDHDRCPHTWDAYKKTGFWCAAYYGGVTFDHPASPEEMKTQGAVLDAEIAEAPAHLWMQSAHSTGWAGAAWVCGTCHNDLMKLYHAQNQHVIKESTLFIT